MGIWTSLFRRRAEALPQSPSLKEQLVTEARRIVEETKVKVVEEKVAITGTAEYVYVDPVATMKTDRSGDSYMEWKFTVLCNKTKLGYMTIWHNRYGAFANFTDTRTYPLG